MSLTRTTQHHYQAGIFAIRFVHSFNHHHAISKCALFSRQIHSINKPTSPLLPSYRRGFYWDTWIGDGGQRPERRAPQKTRTVQAVAVGQGWILMLCIWRQKGSWVWVKWFSLIGATLYTVWVIHFISTIIQQNAQGAVEVSMEDLDILQAMMIVEIIRKPKPYGTIPHPIIHKKNLQTSLVSRSKIPEPHVANMNLPIYIYISYNRHP